MDSDRANFPLHGGILDFLVQSNEPKKAPCTITFRGHQGLGWGGGVTTYMIGFTNGHRLFTWKKSAEDILELCDVMLNSGCRESVKRLLDATQHDRS